MSLGKGVAKYGLVGLSKLISLSTLKGLAGRSLYVVNYHSIARADEDPYVNENAYRTVDEFEQDLRFYKRHFKIIGGIELIELITSNRPIPKDTMMITFDDGLRINYDLQLPILKKHGVTATFFLCSAFIDNKDLHHGRKANLIRRGLNTGDDNLKRRVAAYMLDHNIFDGDVQRSLTNMGYRDRVHLEEIARLVGLDFQDYLSRHRPYMDYQQIQEMMDSGFTIGAHSIDHPRYGELPLQQQLEQTIESMDTIVNLFQIDYRMFAFPYNDDTLIPEFYREIQPHVDITFGMGGFVDDSVSFNIQRSEVESTGLPVDRAIKYRLLLAWLHRISM